MNIPRRKEAGRWVGGLLTVLSVWTLVACGGSNATDTASNVTRSATPLLSTQTSTDSQGSTSTSGSADNALASDMRKDASDSGTATATAASTEGRLLASNCFQCHGTNGTGGFESIRGGEADEIMEFLTKTASRDIMAAHAHGYTNAQLQKIIAYLQQ